ncbi:MAG: RNA polymerase sigma factor [Lachnospiraceae bacterium]|nr:RNA polymerase sigma factor [Lachnospiraceae bacterium]
MNVTEIERYIDKVYAYAVKRTFSEEEAADLSQEILFAAVKGLPGLREESKFEPWLWGIAGNVAKSFRRKQGRQRAMYSYDMPEDLSDNGGLEQEIEELEELYGRLRKNISMLSAMYRDIIILFYYDNLSTKTIADRLGIPEGTVTWRLSEARRKLKKECVKMEESALRPVKLHLDIYGSGNFDGVKIPFPTAFIDDALSQNILYYCYDRSKSTEELAKLCGVPAYYVEDRLENLVKREAVIETVKGKYQTDFIIWSDKYGIYCEENAGKAIAPMKDKMIAALKALAAEAGKIDFYKAEKKESDLFYLYSSMALEYMLHHYCELSLPEIRENYDGMRWRYIGNMETGAHERISFSINRCGNNMTKGHYTHTVYVGIDGIPSREIMYDNYINACEDILLTGSSDDVDAAALAIQSEYIIRRENGELFVTVPAFTAEQKTAFDALVEKHLSPLIDEYNELTTSFIKGYKKLFPKHLQEDADRMCRNIYFGLGYVLLSYAQKTGSIEPPAPGCFCDVMLEKRT